MRLPIVERTARGTRRVGSLYLLSALLVLLGGYLNLRDWHGTPLTVALGAVFGTHLAYEAALLLAIGFLHRGRGEVRDTVVLLGILGVFLADGLLIQHLYGWQRGEGLLAGAIGAGSAVVCLALVAALLDVPVVNRLFAALLLVVLFERFAPALLDAAPRTPGVAPRFVALGWLLAVLPLAVWLPSLSRARSRLPLAEMERWGVSGSLLLAAIHFVNAGNSFDLSFRVIYLAPFVAVLGPALERLAPPAPGERATRGALAAMPYIGLALAASEFPPGLLDAHWAQAWPLTPFYLVLLLTAAIQVARSLGTGDSRLRHAGAFLLLLASLGGDFPEILTAARYPRPWQALAVATIAWTTIVLERRWRPGTWLMTASGFVVASFLSDRGYPWLWGFLLCLGWGGLLLEGITGWLLPRGERLALASLITVLPVLVLLLDPGSRLRLAMAASHVVVALLIGWRRRDRLLRQLAPAALAIGVIGYPMVSGRHAGAAPGWLLIEAGFVLLGIGLLHSVYGGRVGNEWRIWWEEGARARSAPAPASPARAER